MRPLIHMDNIPYEQITKSIELGIFEHLHIAVALISKNMEFIYCNYAFIQMYRLPQNPIGKRIDNFLITNDGNFEENFKQYKMAIICLRSSSHDSIYAISLSYPIYDEKNQYQGIFIETMSMTSDKENLSKLIETTRTIEMKTWPAMQDKKRTIKKRLLTFEDIVGQSHSMQKLRQLGTRIAQSDEPVLICGESGTGKELVAQAIHMASPRADASFVCVNCAALPSDLMESELFGYEPGAFTGAKTKGMIGKFEEAHNGTIFLDEIGELPLAMQAKLLRVLESGEIQKIAHKGPIRSNFRLVTATNKNLIDMVRAKQFREDLYHRLNVFELSIPPLRDREDDIFLLLRFFILQSLGSKRALQITFEDGLIDSFQKYFWPGNVRELKNIMTHALFLLGEDENILEFQHLPHRFQQYISNNTKTDVEFEVGHNSIYGSTLRNEREILQSALSRYHYNKVLIARELGISRSKLYRDLHKYGLFHEAKTDAR